MKSLTSYENMNKNKIKIFKTHETANKLYTRRNTNESFHNGRWTSEEHKKFLEACLKYGSNWKKVISKFKIYYN